MKWEDTLFLPPRDPNPPELPNQTCPRCKRESVDEVGWDGWCCQLCGYEWRGDDGADDKLQRIKEEGR